MRVYIVTLLNRVERQLNSYHLANQIRSWGMEPVEFEATDYTTRKFREIQYAASSELERPLTPGELACSWSHIRACQEIVKNGHPGFVLEDDAKFLYPLSEVDTSIVADFMSLSHWAPHDEGNQFDVITKFGEADLVRGLPYGTQCYFMTPEGAEKFLAEAVPVRWPSDVALDKLSRAGILETLLAHQPVAIQHPVISSHIGQR